MPRHLPLSIVLSLSAVALPAAGHAQTAQATSPALERFFADWRRFVQPDLVRGVPDYGPAAIAAKAAALPDYRARLEAIDRNGWSQRARDDYRLVQAELNGFDFDLRVLQPWARDPGYYRTIFGEESDVPAHEGPNAAPTIDLFKRTWPLSRADDARLTRDLAAIPALLTAARTNLAGSNARDLWVYGDRSFHEQNDVLDTLARGTLTMRTLDGQVPATITGASAGLLRAIGEAKAATDAFARWIATEAPRKTGPSGVGKAAYDVYARTVALSPYGWDAQMLLLQRELDRALASLRLEETRNRALPPIAPIEDPAAYRTMALAKTQRFNDFLVATGLVPDRPYFRAAMLAQTSNYVAPAERNFFFHGTALDPLPLLSHSTHWIELARLKHAPDASAIRRSAPLFNLFADRSEGFATAMEEIVMHAGLYDDVPRAREIVWIMLANRAARGIASLKVQANEIDLAEAGRFHATWTPRGWSDPASPLVGFEQLLYLRQPGYGPSYIVGKVQLDALLAAESHRADLAGKPFVLRDAMARIIAAGIVPPALIESELAAPR